MTSIIILLLYLQYIRKNFSEDLNEIAFKLASEILTMISRIPLGRVGTHEELGILASFLMSDGSGYITGEVVTMDGGEFVAGAGEFNFLAKYSDEEWAAIKASMKR